VTNDQEMEALDRIRKWLSVRSFRLTRNQFGDSNNWREDYRGKRTPGLVGLSSTRGDPSVDFGIVSVSEPTLPDVWLFALDGTPVVTPRVSFVAHVNILMDKYQEFVELARAEDGPARLATARAHAVKVIMSPPWYPMFGD